MKKAVWISMICVIAAGSIVMGILVLKNTGSSKKSESAVLLGSWTMTYGYSPVGTEKVTFKNRTISFYDYSEEKYLKCGYQASVEEYYPWNTENSMTITFAEGEGPDCGEYLYHTQEVDGHTVRILSAFITEDDGRGMIVDAEFIHDDDLKYVSSDFRSDLYYKLINAEAPATYLEE